MRYKVTVVGAGNVGATAAQLIAQASLADVVLVDVAAELATGKALDMMESAPILGFNALITGGGSYEPTAGSHVCVVTAGLARKPGMSRDDLLAKNTEIVSEVVRQLVKHSPDTILIIVTNPLDAMCEVARRVSGFPRERVFGMAGVLDAARMRWFIAEKLKVSVEDVDAFVLGGHGDTMVPLPRYATVNGVPLPQLLDSETIEQINDRTRNGGAEIVNYYKTGSAYYAPGAASYEMVAAILQDKKKILPCAVLLKGEYGYDDLFIGVPCVLGSRGMEKVVELKLTVEEKGMLDKSAQAVRGLVEALPKG
ncbi:MAG TPA: malate dehydrogenase [Thermoanaerobaculia bacterium]|nr:malate dehydrogenase [Thermoanaerobaculia bacterium]HSK81550.1 malate dehydrogenase [Thermoanaerobaculia bacterium]